MPESPLRASAGQGGMIKKVQHFSVMLRLMNRQTEHRIVPYAKKIVLRSRWGYRPGLETLVAEFRRDGVRFVGVVGKDCDLIEDIIDELCSNNDWSYPLRTSSHVDESVEQAVSYARGLDREFDGEVQVVEF